MTTRIPLVVLSLAALAAACQQPAAVAGSTHAANVAVLPALADDRPTDLPGLHNVVRYADDLVSGSVPHGDEGFAALEAMGIRTVVSVDGATPQVELAARHGLRYVHLPISYDGVPAAQAAAMAQALSSLEGPFYFHCHHGKHRSAAAAAAACVGAGLLTNAAAAARMQVSGTSANYAGLWADVAAMRPLAAAALRADPAAFPAVAEVSGMVATMAELDVVFDNLKALDQNGWQVPADHPDLVPQQEAARLLALFTGLQQDAESQAYAADYQQLLTASIEHATALDGAMRGGDVAAAATAFGAVGKSCKACHGPYRNQ